MQPDHAPRFSGSLALTDTAFRAFLAVICCVAVGAVFFQLRIFSLQAWYVRVMSFALIGAATFFMLRSRFPGFTAGAVFFLFFLDVLFYSKSLGTPRIITDGYTFAVPVASSMVFLRWFYRKPGRRYPVNPVAFGLVAAASELVAYVIWLVALYRHFPHMSAPDALLTIFDRLRFGFVMGFGLGLGILVTEYWTLGAAGRLYRKVTGK